MFDQFINLAIAFLIGIFVARYLGPNNFGILNFGKSIANIFVVFCTLGIEKIVIKDLLNNNKPATTILGTGFFLKTMASLLCIIGILIYSFFFSKMNIQDIVILIFVLVTFFDAFSIIRFYFQSRVQARFTSRIGIFKISLSTALKIVLIAMKASVLYFALISLFEALVGAIGLVIVFVRKSKLKWKDLSFSGKYGLEMIKDSWPLFFSNFVVLIYMEVDQIMLKYILDTEAVGLYSVSVRLTNVWFVIGSVICSSLFPAILNAKKLSAIQYNKRVFNLLRFLVVIGYCIAIPLFFLSDYFVVMIYGNSYSPSIAPLKIQLWSIPFVYLGIVGSQWYIIENFHKMLLIRSAFGAILNVVLNLFLIPAYGINGAAIATLISQISVNVFGNLFSSKTKSLLIMQLRALLIFW